MITIQGKGVSAGVGVGPLYFYRRATAEIKRYTVEDTDAEWHRFKGAQTGAIEQLGVLAEQARKEAGDEAAMLFETHQMMAEDLDYEEAIEDRIVNQKMNAEAAVSDTSEQFAEMFASMDDAYMQARAADVKDVSQRILGILCGIVQGGIASDVPVLLCADDLAPSETIQLDKSKVLGFITAGGSGSSHTAILARTMGIPAIVGVGDALKPEYEGRSCIIDGATGNVVIDPDDMTRDYLLKKREEQLRLQRVGGIVVHLRAEEDDAVHHQHVGQRQSRVARAEQLAAATAQQIFPSKGVLFGHASSSIVPCGRVGQIFPADRSVHASSRQPTHRLLRCSESHSTKGMNVHLCTEIFFEGLFRAPSGA